MPPPEEARDGGRSDDGRDRDEQVDACDPASVRVLGELAGRRRAHDAQEERRLAEERHHHRVLPAEATGNTVANTRAQKHTELKWREHARTQ